MNVSFQPDLCAMFGKPLGARFQVRSMFWLSRNAGKSKVLAEFTNKAVFILFQITFNGLHASGQLNKKEKGNKAEKNAQ
jgi:hypothetical protein